MKTNLRAYAPIGLGIALIGLLGLIGVLVTRLVIYLGLYYPTNPDLIKNIGYVSLGALILGLAIFAFLDPERARMLVTGRQVHYASNAVITLLAVTGILVVLNMLAYQYPRQFDLTQNKQNTLSPETLATLAALPGEVTAYAFYASGLPDETRILLDSYISNSDGKFSYTVKNTDLDPVLAEQLQVTRDGTIVLVLGEQKEPLSYATEYEITAGLVRLINPASRTVYFVTGHGERDTETPGETSLTTASKVLQSKNYAVNTLNLASMNSIPEDASVVIIAGPQKPLSQKEVDMIDSYLASGGSLILMQEPSILTDFGDSPDPLADLLATKWGISFQDDLIIDPNVNPMSATSVVNYGNHPITINLLGVYTVFDTARSMVTGENTQSTLTSLLFTSDGTWGETSFENPSENQVQFDPQNDFQAPQTLGVAAEDNVTQSRVVAIGDVDFASDYLYTQYANGDLFINSVDWAAGQEKIISLTPKDATERNFLPPSTGGLLLIVSSAVCLIPLAILVAGIVAWVSRRKRG